MEVVTSTPFLSSVEKLVPVPVEWSVSTSSRFRIEILDEHEIEVSFTAISKAGRLLPPSDRCEKLITCRFGIVGGTRTAPPTLEGYALDRKKYNSELIGEFDPRFYVVEGSLWLEDERATGNPYVVPESQNYLILGADFSYQLLAAEFRYGESE